MEQANKYVIIIIIRTQTANSNKKQGQLRVTGNQLIQQSHKKRYPCEESHDLRLVLPTTFFLFLSGRAQNVCSYKAFRGLVLDVCVAS
jgi:hypothetical protein